VISETRDCAEVHDDWQRFQAVATMVNHWDRPGWSAGQQAYYWYLTFDDPELVQLAKTCQAALKAPYLDPVPLDGLHLTLPRVGWTDDVTEGQLSQLVTEAERVCRGLGPITLTIGPLSGSPGAVRFSVSPWQPVVSLNNRLRSVTEATLRRMEREPEFRPHIGIAYCNSPVQASRLLADVARLRDLPTVEVTVEEVELVRVRREAQTYVWTTGARIPLN
jgi:2'-5' RNA ligase